MQAYTGAHITYFKIIATNTSQSSGQDQQNGKRT